MGSCCASKPQMHEINYDDMNKLELQAIMAEQMTDTEIDDVVDQIAVECMEKYDENKDGQLS